MKKIIPVHHSITDWDFQDELVFCSLSADQFVSPPTSIRMLNPGSAPEFSTVLCRIPATQCLPQGEVRTWIYEHTRSQYPACFRNQAPLGTSNFQNCYYVYLTGTTSKLQRLYLGAGITVDQSVCQTFADTWTHYRVFWYNGKTPADAPALCVDLYREIAGEWVKEGETLYDTNNYFKDSDINRAGFIMFSRLNYPEYLDNTEIWGPV